MKKILTLSLSVATAMILTTGCTGYNENLGYSKTHKADWGYVGKNSPENWGKMKEEFAMCSKGKMQTPIDIIATQDVDVTPLELDYKTTSTTIINNGHTVQVNISSGSTVTIDNIKYELKQFHFHTPSENNINGEQYQLEAHFVHASKDNELAVIAVMFKEGKEDPILKKIWSTFPLEKNKEVSFDLSSSDIQKLIPSNKDYYKFMGSLTTPPCSENVKWNVFKTSLTISKEQVKQFFDISGHTNNRPIQDTNNRIISE